MPSGVTVDATGCSIDSDGDGITNYMEKCPDIPTGEAISVNAVKNYLIRKGIDGSRLNAKGYGSTRSVADNATSTGRGKNRQSPFIRKNERGFFSIRQVTCQSINSLTI